MTGCVSILYSRLPLNRTKKPANYQPFSLTSTNYFSTVILQLPTDTDPPTTKLSPNKTQPTNFTTGLFLIPGYIKSTPAYHFAKYQTFSQPLPTTSLPLSPGCLPSLLQSNNTRPSNFPTGIFLISRYKQLLPTIPPTTKPSPAQS